MIKTINSKENKTYRQLGRFTFFKLSSNDNIIYQKVGETLDNSTAISLEETETNHGHSHSYKFSIATYIKDTEIVIPVTVVKIEITEII